MAQQRVTCARCGNQEAAGVQFCGRCGAPMAGGRDQRPAGARPGRPASQIATGAGAATGGGFMQNPAAIAAVLGVVAVVIVAAALLLSGGDGEKGGNGQARRGADPGGDFTTQVIADPAGTPTPIVLTIPTPTPQPEPTPEPTPVPQPTPEPPAPTPIPPAPTPIPPEPTPIPPASTPVPPSPTPLPPVVLPARVTSPEVRLGICTIQTPQAACLQGAAGHGSTFPVGTFLRICYQATQANRYVRVYDSDNISQPLFAQVTNTSIWCRDDAQVTEPVGPDTLRADIHTNQGGPRVGTATISILVVK